MFRDGLVGRLVMFYRSEPRGGLTLSPPSERVFGERGERIQSSPENLA